jgi:maltose alpha-D-glucosyltransferase/alpha-amylase
MAEKSRDQFETDALPRYIETQRWYAAKSTTIERVRIAEQVLWQDSKLIWLVALVDLEGGTEPSSYFLPLALAWEDGNEDRLRALSTAAVAKVRQQGNVGIIGDAFADEVFCRAIAGAMAARRDVAMPHGKLTFRPTAAFESLAGADYAALAVNRPRASSSNTVVTFGERLMLKGYRRLREGINPELEVGLYLTEVLHYPNCAPLAGMLEYVADDGQTRLLALLQGYVANQGDGWTYSLDYLRRHLEQYRTTPADQALPQNAHDAYLAMIRVLATRTAELHQALARPTDNPAFAMQRLARGDIDGYRKRALDEAREALTMLASMLEQLPPADRDIAHAVLAKRDQILARIEGYTIDAARGAKIRIHGDYHLGQVLVTRNDFVIIDFEGEPGHSLQQRRAKQSPLRDVAGMLRSFSYVKHSAMRSVAHTEAEAAHLEPLASGWERQVRTAFLDAYGSAANASSLYASLVPGEGLLGLFEFEKALYELRYELGNRPGWARVPLEAIATLDANV